VSPLGSYDDYSPSVCFDWSAANISSGHSLEDEFSFYGALIECVIKSPASGVKLPWTSMPMKLACLPYGGFFGGCLMHVAIDHIQPVNRFHPSRNICVRQLDAGLYAFFPQAFDQ